MSRFPIGILDSGIGGASILKEIIKILPNERFVYMADTKNLPYGNKSKRKIMNIVQENVENLIKNYKIKLLVLACNTASSVCSNSLRKKVNIPVICVEPPIKPAIECGFQNILVLATKRTLKSNQTLKNNIKNIKIKNRKLDKSQKINIKKLGIKSLASEIDKNCNHLDYVQDLLDKKLNRYKNYNAVILGCTHYNFIKKQIQKSLPFTKIISCEMAVAKRTKFILERENLASKATKKEKNIIILTKTNFKLKRFLTDFLIN